MRAPDAFVRWLILSMGLYSTNLRAIQRDVFSPRLHSFSDSTIGLLKSVNDRSTNYADAQQLLAEAYLEKNTVVARRQAEEFARKAVLLRPNELSYHLTLLKILYEKGFYLAASETCTDILSKKPVGESYNKYYAEAYYYKGLMAERSALKYKDMVSFVESTGGEQVLSLANYGVQDLKLAASYFEQSLQYQSDHRDAMFHLALLYMEIHSYERMAKIFDRVIELSPDDKDSYIYAALAHYHMGESDLAFTYYQRAFTLMTKEEFAAYNNIEYIVPSGQLSAFNKMKNTSAYEQDFWRKKDPLLLTLANERLLEHYNRVAYANLRYSVPKQQIPGWKTERGKIYIRYGTPSLFYSVQPDIGLLGGAQMWQYPNFSFYFRDEYAGGNFLMDDASILESRSAYNTIEDIYDLPTEKCFDVKSRIYQFRGSDRTTKLKAYFNAVSRAVDNDFETFGMDVPAVGGLFFLNKDKEIVSQLRTQVTLDAAHESHGCFVRYFELDHVEPNSQVVSYSLEIQTLAEMKSGVSRDSIRIRDFSGDRLFLSDVVLAENITAKEEINIVPHFSNVVSKNNDIYLYFETYNLTLDDRGQARYKIETHFVPKNKNIVQWMRGVLSGTSDYKVASAFEATSRSTEDHYYFALDVKNVKKGKYQFMIRVVDELSGQSSSQIIPIEVTE